ncbi:PaaI family thioesterase [Desulfohalobiaceae bacterium Ax17]|uniref:PaaI family thioesterase n=1 Tax=Desulfovulcanus ferrireducens TaxID=2831190 RepID=UPI00207BC617|nr:PaaI family thioesterase [Desulfovulcanus ferrireducens]
MENIKKFFKNDRFAEHVGIELLEVSKGYARAKLEIRNEHLNSVGTVHGGAIFALADLVFAVASNSHGTIAMGINVSISYLKAVREGTIFAEAKEISKNPKLASYTVTVSDQSGDTIAIFQGMVYRKKDKLPVPAKE